MPFAEPNKKHHKLLWIIGIIITVLALATAGDVYKRQHLHLVHNDRAAANEFQLHLQVTAGIYLRFDGPVSIVLQISSFLTPFFKKSIDKT